MEERQSNIELLRIISTIGVIILHYNNRESGGAFLYTQDIALNRLILIVFESFFVCAVDVFIMISGYFLANSKERNLSKIFELFIQVVFFSEANYFARCIFGQISLSAKGILISAIPNNYFVVLYSVLYIVSPLINFSLDNVSHKYKTRTIILLFILFSVFPSIVDVMNIASGEKWNGLSTIGFYGSQWGYNIVNFVLMYCIGYFVRNDGLRIKVFTIIVGLMLDVTVMSLLAFKFSEDIAWSYCSPLVVAEAILMMLLFLKIDIGSNKIINNISKGCFTCFLSHASLLKFARIARYSVGEPIALILHVLFTGLIVFLLCWIAFLIYSSSISLLLKNRQKHILKY